MTTTTVNKNLEQKFRRALNSIGYALRKSRSPFGIDNMGEYMIVDLRSNVVVAGPRFDLSLEDVPEWLEYLRNI